jgi:LemA protein
MTSESNATHRRQREGLVLVGLLSLVVLVGIDWAISINNQLVAQEQGVYGAWARMQASYQRRADLALTLVEKVKSIATPEHPGLEDLIAARTTVIGIKVTRELMNDPSAFQNFQQANQELGASLSRLLVVADRSPWLKSDQSFLALETQLQEAENGIAVEQMRYSATVRDYNIRLTLFPASVVASFRGFREKPPFETVKSQSPGKAKH